jgi:hypothetical protein
MEMKKVLVVLLTAGFFLGIWAMGILAEEEGAEFVGFGVYEDKWTRTNHYVPSGWMGDYSAITMDDNYRTDPHSGVTCIEFTYSGETKQGAGWAGIYWQNPANNWGYRKGGFDLTGAKALTFWAKGEKGGEVIGEFKMGGISGEYSDSDSTGIGPVTLTNEWKKYTIDLEGLDLSYISGGFCWVCSRLDNPESITFYLDDINYE